MKPERVRTREDLVAALHEKYRAQGWSVHRLAEASGVSAGAIQKILRGDSLPQGQTLGALAKAFGEDPEAWLMARGRLVAAERAPARPSAAVRSGSAPGRWIDELDDTRDAADFEVHPAIGVGHDDLPVLPAYVRRAHDTDVGALVEQARAGASVALMLVGDSSTGKTRTAWEAVRQLGGEPAPWRIWHPLGQLRPEAVLEEVGHVVPRTVVWLNEAQLYLLTQPADAGERVATALESLLRAADRAPVLILGTIWPDYLSTLTTKPETHTEHDAHAAARQFLRRRTVEVPSAFGDEDRESLRRQAVHDARLAKALAEAHEHEIAQYLAGGPALLERLKVMRPAPKALVLAAMDLRRLGHGERLPGPLLEAAAMAHLSRSQREDLAPNWTARAWADAEAKVTGAVRPLTRLRLAEVTTYYRLADYLEQHARSQFSATCPRSEWWAACVEHAHTGSDLYRLGVEAHARRLYAYADDFYEEATAWGHLTARWTAAQLLIERGDLDAVREDDITDVPGYLALAREQARQGRFADAREAWRTAIALGRSEEDLTLEWLVISEDIQLAVEFTEDLGLEQQPLRVARMLARHGHWQRAADEYRPLARSGSAAALSELVQCLIRLGDEQQALAELESADVFDVDLFKTHLTLLTDHPSRQICERLRESGGEELHRLELALLDDDELQRAAAADEVAGNVWVRRLARRDDVPGLVALASSTTRFSRRHYVEELVGTGEEEALRLALTIVDEHLSGSLLIEELRARALIGLGDVDGLRAQLASGRGGRRVASDYFREHEMLDDLRAMTPSSDKYVNKRLAFLLDDLGLTEELAELAEKSHATAKLFPKHLIRREDWARIGDLVVKGDSFMQGALSRHFANTPVKHLTEQARRVRREGFDPDGSVR